jgi:hypothetical protein
MSAIVDHLADVLEDELPDVPTDARRRVLAELCRRIGGEKHYLPRRLPGDAAARVAEALAAGATIERAAIAGGVSARHARRLCGTSAA